MILLPTAQRFCNAGIVKVIFEPLILAIPVGEKADAL